LSNQTQGNHYLKIKLSANHSHSSEGLGEGLISLMFIADALYDSPVGSLLVIDEPELSLHPALLRKLSQLLSEYAKDRQIVLATHSPYFADLSYIAAGAHLARVYVDESGCRISSLSSSTGNKINGLLANLNVPHIFGLDAREIFFQDDGVILVEGQEDVVRYRLIEEQLGTKFEGAFFGWGVEGFGNFKVCAQILSELGFSRVASIVDGDHPEVASELTSLFPKFKFFVIPAADVRTKPETQAKPGKEGLLDLDGTIRPQFQPAISQLISEVNAYLKPKEESRRVGAPTDIGF
jgi:predicted ATP-dependent endonuclease of OLD family